LTLTITRTTTNDLCLLRSASIVLNLSWVE